MISMAYIFTIIFTSKLNSNIRKNFWHQKPIVTSISQGTFLVLAKRSNLSLDKIIPLSTYASGRSLKFMRSEMSKRRCDIRYLAFLPFPLGGSEIVNPWIVLDPVWIVTSFSIIPWYIVQLCSDMISICWHRCALPCKPFFLYEYSRACVWGQIHGNGPSTNSYDFVPKASQGQQLFLKISIEKKKSVKIWFLRVSIHSFLPSFTCVHNSNQDPAWKVLIKSCA